MVSIFKSMCTHTYTHTHTHTHTHIYIYQRYYTVAIGDVTNLRIRVGTQTFFVSFSVLLAVPISGLMLDRVGTQALAALFTGVVFLGGVCYVAARALMVGKLLSPKTKM